MKTLLITFIMFAVTSTGKIFQDTVRVSGTYERHEDGIYYFKGDKGEIFEFHDVTEEVSEAFDLMDQALIGTLFSITFTLEISEEDETEYNTIIALKRIE